MKNILLIFGLLVLITNLSAMQEDTVSELSSVIPESPAIPSSGASSARGLWSEDKNSDTAKFYLACDTQDVKTIHHLVSKIDSTIPIPTILQAQTRLSSKPALVQQLTLAHTFLTAQDITTLQEAARSNPDIADQYLYRRLMDTALTCNTELLLMLTTAFRFDDKCIVTTLRLVTKYQDKIRNPRPGFVDDAFEVINILQLIQDEIAVRKNLEDLLDLEGYKAGVARLQRRLGKDVQEHTKVTVIKVNTKPGTLTKKCCCDNCCCETCCGVCDCFSCWTKLWHVLKNCC